MAWTGSAMTSMIAKRQRLATNRCGEADYFFFEEWNFRDEGEKEKWRCS
jgi:hypothetical protein